MRTCVPSAVIILVLSTSNGFPTTDPRAPKREKERNEGEKKKKIDNGRSEKGEMT